MLPIIDNTDNEEKKEHNFSEVFEANTSDIKDSIIEDDEKKVITKTENGIVTITTIKKNKNGSLANTETVETIKDGIKTTKKIKRIKDGDESRNYFFYNLAFDTKEERAAFKSFVTSHCITAKNFLIYAIEYLKEKEEKKEISITSYGIKDLK